MSNQLNPPTIHNPNPRNTIVSSGTWLVPFRWNIEKHLYGRVQYKSV